MDGAPKDATSHTRATLSAPLPAFDPADVERARRGLIATHPTGTIDGPFGPAWSTARHEFTELGRPCPDTVHPSLWRQAGLNAIHGLFEVAPGIWQGRGYDIANITFIAGTDGWIVIDPLTTEATAAACLALADEHLGARPVTAVIYTHSHADHYGGVLGVTSQADVDAGRCRVIAPEHFMREVVGENLLAGPAMGRRALYQFGPLLPPGPRGHVDCGLGKGLALAPAGLIAPTEEIVATGQELVVDGVRIEFQLTPDAEAPAEMNFFFPDHGWLCLAENCTHNMHNLVPIRGALVRDALSWSKYIGEAIELYGRRAVLSFASHHWPRWGTDDVVGFLSRQRDLYRWIHDQTLRFANQGLVASEIAETLTLPQEFRDESHTTGYYGHLVHNVKAVYQRYLSWYDGNPAHLHQHPPVEAGHRYVALAGGADALLTAARAAFADGDYRWVAELVNHLVFADPTNVEARHLQADALEQLGYQSESATYRNAYLMGAHELRHGSPSPRPVPFHGLVKALAVPELVDSMGVRLRAEELGGVAVRVAFTLTDVDEQWVIGVAHRAIHAVAGEPTTTTDASVRTTIAVLRSLASGETTLDDALADGRAVLESGTAAAAGTLFAHLDPYTGGFAIIEP